MIFKKFSKIDLPAIDKIISVAYGDADLPSTIYIKFLSLFNQNIKTILSEYSITAKEVHAIAEDEIPDYLLNQISKNVKNSKGSFIVDLFSILFNRPIISAVASTAVIAAIVVSLLFQTQHEIKYSQQEIKKADAQARYALSIIGSILNQTSSTLQNEVLNKNVSQPINNGVNVLNKLFKGGTK